MNKHQGRWKGSSGMVFTFTSCTAAAYADLLLSVLCLEAAFCRIYDTHWSSMFWLCARDTTKSEKKREIEIQTHFVRNTCVVSS